MIQIDADDDECTNLRACASVPPSILARDDCELVTLELIPSPSLSVDGETDERRGQSSRVTTAHVQRDVTSKHQPSQPFDDVATNGILLTFILSSIYSNEY